MNTTVKNVLLISLLASLSLPAQTVSYIGDGMGGAGLAISLNTPWQGTSSDEPLETTGFALTIDVPSLTITFDEIEIKNGPGSGTLTRNYTTGFGESVDVTAIVDFDTIDFSVSNIGPIDLLPLSDGDYLIPTTTGTVLVPISGDYSLSDGIGFQEGTFEKQVSASYEIRARLITSDYPESIQISSFNQTSIFLISEFLGVELFSDTINGVDVSFRGEFLTVTTTESLVLESIPEPSIVTLLLGVFSLWFIAFRRQV